jgi:pimeloyl-ACP methyl ester carboxylesterase
MYKRNWVVLFLVSLIFVSCDIFSGNTDDSAADLRGTLVSSTNKGTFNKAWVNTFISFNNLPFDATVKTGFNLKKVVYYTQDAQGNNIEVSGSIFIPDSVFSYHLVSVQHGTEIKRASVGTESVYYAIEGILMATQGYYVVYPDYIGLGISELSHPFILMEPSANTVIDMIRAGRNYAEQEGHALDDNLLLMGYSEGGFVTLSTHREIAINYADEFSILGSAPMAGPYDVKQTASILLSNDVYSNPGYLGYILNAYNEAYNLYPISDIFAQQYVATVDTLYNGLYDMGQINSALTTNLNELFNTEFLAAYRNGGKPDLENAFVENSPLDWICLDNIRFYHGSNDITVFPENMVTAVEALKTNGSTHVESFSIEGGTHYTSFFPSINHTITWFDSLRQGF